MRITISITICSEASKNFNNLSYTSTKIGNYEKNLLKIVWFIITRAQGSRYIFSWKFKIFTIEIRYEGFCCQLSHVVLYSPWSTQKHWTQKHLTFRSQMSGMLSNYVKMMVKGLKNHLWKYLKISSKHITIQRTWTLNRHYAKYEVLFRDHCLEHW